MKLAHHRIIEHVLQNTAGLQDVAMRDLGEHCVCFSAMRDGKRLSITVDDRMIPPVLSLGRGWDEFSVALYIAAELTEAEDA